MSSQGVFIMIHWNTNFVNAQFIDSPNNGNKNLFPIEFINSPTPQHQSCVPRKIMRNPNVPNREILGAQHLNKCI